jgi:hypothetical protein
LSGVRCQEHFADEATLVAAIARVLTEQRVDGLLSVAWDKQVEQTPRYVGRGRGSGHREKQVIEKVRSHIPHITRQADNLAVQCQRFG